MTLLKVLKFANKRIKAVKICEIYLANLEIFSLSSIRPTIERGKQIKGMYQPYIEENTLDINEKIIPVPEGTA